MILVFKLIATPFFIGAVSLAGRKWGPTISGLLMGLPLTSGPIAVFLTIQYGNVFAVKSAAGNLAGQASVCFFCLAYSLSARKLNWAGSTLIAWFTLVLSTLLMDRFNLSLLPSFALLGIVIGLVLWGMPRGTAPLASFSPPQWDLPARMLIATVFVLALTTFANLLGPGLSGLIASFPIFGTIIAVFTQRQQGSEAVARLLRGIVSGSPAYAAFFLVTGVLLPHLPAGWTYILASIAALSVGAGIFFAPRLIGTNRVSNG